MKTTVCSLLLALGLSTYTVANAAGSMLRVSCDGDDIGAEVLINGKFKGECPLDIQVPEGALKLLVRKTVNAQRERVFEQEIRMGEGVAKKVEARLGAASLSVAEKERRANNQQRLEKMPVDALQKEAASGNVNAMRQLAVRNRDGSNGVVKNLEMEVTWWRKAAEAGDAESMHLMGLIYGLGANNVPQSDEQAMQWYRKAVAVGHGPSMHSLGNHYRFGDGVPKDEAAAAQWYRRAADAGNAEGMVSLGNAYEMNEGVPKSFEQAIVWYRKAVEVEDENDMVRSASLTGMYRLGYLYAKGRGVPQDEQQAIYWWRKAAEGQYPNGSAVRELKERGLR